MAGTISGALYKGSVGLVHVPAIYYKPKLTPDGKWFQEDEYMTTVEHRPYIRGDEYRALQQAQAQFEVWQNPAKSHTHHLNPQQDKIIRFRPPIYNNVYRLVHPDVPTGKTGGMQTSMPTRQNVYTSLRQGKIGSESRGMNPTHSSGIAPTTPAPFVELNQPGLNTSGTGTGYGGNSAYRPLQQVQAQALRDVRTNEFKPLIGSQDSMLGSRVPQPRVEPLARILESERIMRPSYGTNQPVIPNFYH